MVLFCLQFQYHTYLIPNILIISCIVYVETLIISLFSDDILDYQTSLDIDEFIIEQRRMAAYIVSDYHAELLLSQLKPVGDEQPIYRVLDIPIGNRIRIFPNENK